MANCIFCRIVAKEIPTAIVFEDDRALAFQDRDPRAPTHFLVVPKQHLSSIREAEGNEALVGHLLAVAVKVAELQGVAATGFRVTANSGADAGQSVDHLHFHVLGGRLMGWPPG